MGTASVGIARTIASEFGQLLGQGAKRRRVAALQWTQATAKQVVAKDANLVGARARALTRLPVALKGEAGKGARIASKKLVDDGARLANNRVKGSTREGIVESLLKVLFPAKEKYTVVREATLRDRHGRIALDQASQESRRIDFVVFQGDEVVRSVEVTSARVNKAEQLAKEARIRRHGGRYLLHPESHELVRVPAKVKTTVVRLP